jgi:hypothetical protein
MQCRNSLALRPADRSYDFTTEDVRQNIFAVGKLEQDFSVLFDTTENPCSRCGKCERKCTQKLEIIKGVADTYARAKRSNFSRRARIEKLNRYIDNSSENTIAFYPSGITSLVVGRFYRENIGGLRCKIVCFDSNPAVWGKTDNDVPTYSPDDIRKVNPSTIIITSYKFRDEIYDALTRRETGDIRIVKLCEDNELPWLL